MAFFVKVKATFRLFGIVTYWGYSEEQQSSTKGAQQDKVRELAKR